MRVVAPSVRQDRPAAGEVIRTRIEVPLAMLRLSVAAIAVALALPSTLEAQEPDPPETTSRFVETNGIRMYVREAGEGPLVVLAHGFPESSYSWRHQLPALAAAGYRAVAPDQRGYGATDAPDDAERYSIFELVGDLVGLVRALGERQAVIVGHDWGAVVAAHASLLRPDIFPAAVLLSVPYTPRSAGPLPPMEAAETALPEGMTFYQLYFQEPGRAEAELEADVRSALAMAFYSASGNAPPEHRWRPLFRAEDGLLSSVTMPETLPEWLRPEDLDVYTRQFERTGFRPALNWYRNIDRNWRLSAFLTGAKLEPPTLFIGGAVDPILAGGPGREAYDRLEESVPGLTRKVLLEGKGHWIQQEAPDEVNRHLLEFLEGRLWSGEPERLDSELIFDVLREVEAAFSEQDLARWLSLLHSPFVIMAPEGVIAPSSDEEAPTLLRPVMESLRARGYTRSELERATVKLLSPSTALAAVEWIRRGAGEEELERVGATYAFFKAEDGWKIVMITVHPRATVMELK